LTGITDSNGSTVLRDIDYGYEARDNLTSVADLLVPANSETFGYTPRESLASASGPYGQMAFTYDRVGNRVSYAVNPGSGTLTDSYSYPATSNRLSSIALGAGGSRAFTYDASGNVTWDNRTGGGYSYTYDAAGRMASFSINGVLQAEYKYDFAGRQAIRKLYGANPVTIHSVFDAQDRRIAEYNEATGALIREYVWMGWEPIAVIEGGVVYYIRADHIGRPVFATNTSGVKVWTATYTPFGGVHTPTGLPIEARFPGQWYQSESGLHQNWMRDYDPTTGRYIEADPLGLIDGASVYGYVAGNSQRWADPKGERKRPYVLPHSPEALGPDWQPLQGAKIDGMYQCSCSDETLRYDQYNSGGIYSPHWHFYPDGSNLKKTGQYSVPQIGPHLPPGTVIMIEDCRPVGGGGSAWGIIIWGLSPPWENIREPFQGDYILE
jgi:RHS repeat-associated protein